MITTTRHVRQVMGELPLRAQRNMYRGCKLLKRMGFDTIRRSWFDAAYMRRYVVARRNAMPYTRSSTLSSDKSRGSGADWLATPHCELREPGHRLGGSRGSPNPKFLEVWRVGTKKFSPRGSKNLCAWVLRACVFFVLLASSEHSRVLRTCVPGF